MVKIFLDIKRLVYLGNNKINQKKQKRDVSSKSIESFFIAVVMSCRGRLRLIRLIQIMECWTFQLIRCTLLLH